jgi:hypothetical protein
MATFHDQNRRWNQENRRGISAAALFLIMQTRRLNDAPCPPLTSHGASIKLQTRRRGAPLRAAPRRRRRRPPRCSGAASAAGSRRRRRARMIVNLRRPPRPPALRGGAASVTYFMIRTVVVTEIPYAPPQLIDSSDREICDSPSTSASGAPRPQNTYSSKDSQSSSTSHGASIISSTASPTGSGAPALSTKIDYRSTKIDSRNSGSPASLAPAPAPYGLPRARPWHIS